MTWWTNLFSGSFLAPTAAALGALLVSVPVIIHLINRLRYKRVEFAAMEFLLASEQQNRRRVLIEQLLLLLLRVLAVVAATLLIGRVVFDAAQLSVLRGGVSNQIILLDDSMSTGEQAAATSAFGQAKEVVQRLIRTASEASTQQRLTVVRLTAPEESPPALTEQVVDGRTADEMNLAIERLTPSAEGGDWNAALEAVRNRITTDDATEKTTLLIVTDARKQDWAGAAGIASQLEQLDADGVIVNLVRTVTEKRDNLAVTALESTGATTAVGVPMRLRATVTNYGQQPTVGVRVGVEVDGRLIPQTLVIEAIEPGESQSQSFDVVFEDAGPHQVRVSLPADTLEADNERFLALDVPESVGVLLVDGDPAGRDAQFIADALAADRRLTGFEPLIIGPAEVGRTALARYQGVYLVNVGDLSADAVENLADYVRAGGGLVSFVGTATRAEFVNDRLVGSGLFPTAIEPTPQILGRRSEDTTPDIVATEHPVFSVLAGTDNPFLDQVLVARYYKVASADDDSLVTPAEDITPIASLRNGDPLVYEHRLGAGRVLTVLTAAGPGETDAEGRATWNNWARSPSYPVFCLEVQAYVTARQDAGASKTVGEALSFRVDPALTRDTITVIDPAGDVTSLQATPPSPEEVMRTASFTATTRSGVYRVQTESVGGDSNVTTTAFNVLPAEGDLTLVDDETLRNTFAGVSNLIVRDGTNLGWIEAAAAGSSARGWLVGLLLGLLVVEQWWASRLSHA